MSSQSPAPTPRLNILFTFLALIGLCITALGIGFDLLPGSSPGVSVAQLMMILGGIVLMLAGWVLRSTSRRKRLTTNLGKNLGISLVTVLVIILVLEILLSVAGLPTRYPTDIPENYFSPVEWWQCDEIGCRYLYEEIERACERKELSGRRCMINPQGFHDTDLFEDSEDLQNASLRALMLGDSFTFGATAEIGKSWVETVEKQLPDALVWNTGIGGSGTNQAVEWLKAYAPIETPDVVVLGFFMNDFEDNMFPLDSYYFARTADGYIYPIRQYRADDAGNVTKIDNQTDLYYRFNQVEPPPNEFDRWLGRTRLGSLLLNTAGTVQNMLAKVDGQRRQAQVDATRVFLKALKDYTDEHEIPFFILLIPEREDIPAPDEMFNSAIQLFEELDIPYLNPRDSLTVEDYAPEPDIHWNNGGHEIGGMMVAGCLKHLEQGEDLSACEGLS